MNQLEDAQDYKELVTYIKEKAEKNIRVCGRARSIIPAGESPALAR